MIRRRRVNWGKLRGSRIARGSYSVALLSSWP